MDQSTEDQQNNQNNLFPVVGIGASAGGLEAFTQLLKHLPTDTGMAFVLIQHMAPDRRSLLTEILARTTRMPVKEVEDGMAVELDHVYVIPPNTQMTMTQGMLHLAPREKTQGKHHPVNAFFRSLAADRGSRAIGVVLSGSDGDGALGLEAIKTAGGITFAQCEATAQFDGMPNTAVATGHVDFIMPPQVIAEELAKISRHPYVTLPIRGQTEELPENALSAIFTLLQTASGVNFFHYKRATLQRRIRRRMVLYKLDKLEDYVRYLQDNPAEVQALYQDILISVTSFFRDPEAFAALKEKVFPQITQNKSVELPIRIWVPGCATGEEVYSIAICLLEFLTAAAIKPAIQIFGTDLSEDAINKARAGIYRESFMMDVSPERCRRFFIQTDSGYQVSRQVRELCVFARQNLSSDPPFSNLDLISCRNVLIYLGLALQKRVLPVFHYSLKPTGFLMLGTSESPGESSDLFAVVDKKQKIYTRQSVATRLNFDFGTRDYPVAAAKSGERPNENTGNSLDVYKQADQIVVIRYVPAGVLVNDGLDILQFRGETRSYLGPAPGEPSFNLLKMARPGLLLELRTAIHQARRQNVPVRKEGLQLEGNEQLGKVSIEVIPFQAPLLQEQYFLVLFEPVSTSAISAIPEAQESTLRGEHPGLDAEIIQLRQELAASKQEQAGSKQELADTQVYLQSVIEEQEATNQRLTTANEEILSSNEELQSTNEELQTAKEEIQAANEELKTTNEELHSRNLEADRINDDLVNLLNNVNIPILMLGSNLCIRHFTPQAQRIFNLIMTDVGRPISDFRPNINAPDLEALILEVIDTLVVREQEVQDQEGHWYILRIRPYRTTENQIDGAVLALVEIDALKRSAAQLEAARDYAESIVETVREPLVVLDANLRVKSVNRSFYQMFQVTPAETEQRLVFELGDSQWDIPDLRSLLEEVFPHHKQLRDYEFEHEFEHIGPKTMLLNACEILQADNSRTILLAIEDISERKQAEKQRAQLLLSEQAARAEAEAANTSKDEFISILSHELRTPLNAIQGWSALLLRHEYDGATTTRALETINRNARLQSQLIGDLLDVSRIVQGKLQLESRPVDLTSVIEAAIDTVQPAADEKRIQLEPVLAPCSGTISADPGRMQQVIWNLLSNSIKFTSEGGRVGIRLTCSPSHAQVQVIDTGKGISSEFLPYVFERFRQDSSTSVRMYDGLGLGLAIVRHLVKLQHGGTVGAESPGEGQGTTFTVRLPLMPSQPAMNQNYGVSESSPDLTGIKVLVVEDTVDTRDLLAFFLEEEGASVTAVASAEEALAALAQSQPDVLLSDIGMPEVNGYMLMQRVRALSPEQGGQVPAIALTGYAGKINSQQATEAGFQRHLAKPIEPAQLLGVIAELVGRCDVMADPNLQSEL